MAIHDLKGTDCPAAAAAGRLPLLQRERRDALRRQGAVACAIGRAAYLGAYGMSPRHDALLDEATRLEVIVTDSVVEALALENNLIKQRSPRYNILLRDDKNYPVPAADDDRGVSARAGGALGRARRQLYAGPFLPAKFARRTMSLTHKVFGIRSCNEVITGTRHRPCLEYDIKRCLAPCVATICTRGAVRGRRRRHEAVSRRAATRSWPSSCAAAWSTPSDGERFEEAAQLRDAMRTVEAVRERQQKMASAELGDRDVFGVKLGASGAVVQVFIVRGGRVIERFELHVGCRRTAASPRPTSSRRRFSSSMPTTIRRRRFTCRWRPPSRRCSKTGWRSTPGARSASSCRSAATRRA